MRQPPPSLTAPLQGYLQEIATALNALPNVSIFTGDTPNGRVLGTRGDLALNVDSVVTYSSLSTAIGLPTTWWFSGMPPNASSNTSWFLIATIPV